MSFDIFDSEDSQVEDTIPNDPNKLWVGMPEFKQEKVEPYAKIIVRFDSEDDLQEFAKLIDQKLTNKTKSIWHPFKSHWGREKVEWVSKV
jgi:hypothetical protein